MEETGDDTKVIVDSGVGVDVVKSVDMDALENVDVDTGREEGEGWVGGGGTGVVEGAAAFDGEESVESVA